MNTTITYQCQNCQHLKSVKIALKKDISDMKKSREKEAKEHKEILEKMRVELGEKEVKGREIITY